MGIIHEVKKFFMSLIKKYILREELSPYVGLNPVTNADEDGVYADALKSALDDPEKTNIAISSIYSAGKSSVIKTFFSKNKKYKPIYISVMPFSEVIHNKGENGSFNNSDIVSRNIEKSILQQIFYTEKRSKLKLSRFSRLSKESKIKTILISVAVSVLAYVILQLCYNSWLEERISLCKFFIEKYGTPFIIALVLATITAGALIYKCTFLLINKANIKNGKVENFEIEIGDTDESIFNKYLDEIIYYFQVTRHKAVVIEDLDRYEMEAIPIFQKLRELNSIINSSKQVSYQVNFIYAIGDDFLKTAQQRIKFFDIIIPIIPVVSYVYSKEMIWNRLIELESKWSITNNMEKSFINKIAIYIGDKRLINNIINEFIIYKKKLNLENLDDKKLFSIITYKNLYPSDFSDLLKGEGKIIEIFNKKEIFKRKIIDEQKKEISNINKEIEELQDDCFENENILKYALVGHARELYKNNNMFFYIGKNRCTLREIITKSKDDFQNNVIGIGDAVYRNDTIGENQLFEIFTSKENFIKKWDAVENKFVDKTIALRSEIKEKRENINEIKTLNLMQLCERYNCSELFNECDDTVQFFVKSGFIMEDFRDYTTRFIEGDISKSDCEFILSVNNNVALSFDYRLNYKNKIIESFENNDYNKPAMVNIDLLNYLIKKQKFDKVKAIIKSLDNQDYFIDFVNEYITRYGKVDKFAELLVENSDVLWDRAFKYYEIMSEDLDYWVVMYLQNEERAINLDNSFKNYVENYKDFCCIRIRMNVETVVKTLKKLKIKFKHITEIGNRKLFKEIYDNNLYELNYEAVRNMINFNVDKAVDHTGEKITVIHYGKELYFDKVLSVIHNSESLKKLYNYMISNFEEFYELTLNNGIAKHDDEQTISNILNNKKIDIVLKQGVVEMETLNEYNISEYTDNKIIQYILENNKMKMDFNNLLRAYVSYGKIVNDTIANHVSKNILKYKNFNVKDVSDVELINDFWNDYALSSYVKLDDLEAITENNSFKIINFKKCNVEKIQFLIKKDMVVFNEFNYDFIKDNLSEELVGFIKNNKEKYFGNIDVYDLPMSIAEKMFTDNEFEVDEKKLIIKHLGGVLSLSNGSLMKLILTGYPLDLSEDELDNIYVNILQDEGISFDSKLDFLDYILNGKFTQREKYLKYVQCLGDEYKDIKVGNPTAYIKNNELNEKLCKILKKRLMISSYTLNKYKSSYRIWNYK